MTEKTTLKLLSVSKKQIICSEILSVTSEMRKNSRWASSSQTALYTRDDALAASMGLRRIGGPSDAIPGAVRQEVLLMAGFLELKREIRDVVDINTLTLTSLLSPFFALIRSPLSTGPITSAALGAIYHFFVSDFISPDAPDLEPVLAELSSTVSNCKFEASDASSDEVVLYRIMAVIEQCMCGPAGKRLGDIEVCEMLETVLTTCCQMRCSEVLRKYAESTMHAIVRRIFSRLYLLDPQEEEEKLASSSASPSDNELTMTVQTLRDSQLEVPVPSAPAHSEPSTPRQDSIGLPEEKQTGAPKDDSEPRDDARTPIHRSEYGLPSIVELLRVLVKISDPNDRTHTDSTRLTALRILNTAFEVAGSRIGEYRTLIGIIQDEGCKNLFLLARSDNPKVLYMSLRVISSMLETMRAHLKLQQELFLSFTIDRLAPTVPTRAQIVSMAQQKGLTVSPRPGTPVNGSADSTPQSLSEVDEESILPPKATIVPAKGETKELMLETLNQIARYPGFMVDLFVNYDCDVNCEDLFEKLVNFLAKGVFGVPSVGSRDLAQQTSQLLCLDLLLEFVKEMCDRAGRREGLWPPDLPSPHELLESKSRKRLVLTGASRFNTKPKVGLSFLEENKLIYADLSDTVDRPKSLARFLKSCNRLDKRLLGDFLSKPDNTDVLKAFVQLFDFKDKPVADALRELLESFRLPGESQQISRIAETFAEVYFAAGPDEIKSHDAVYILTYSIIMLNTDLHNPQVRKRMTIEDYQKNLRGQNDGSDFSTEFLTSVYDSIRRREIVMPEEHHGQVGFGYAWKELLARTRLAGKLHSCSSSLFDFTMFNSVWKSVIGSVAYAFTTFDDDYTVQRAITGFRQLATLAVHFNLPEVLDYVVVSLSQVSSLVPDTLATRVPHYPVVEVEGQDVTVSSLSVKFGTDFKGQLAAVVLFTITNGNGNAVREGWTQIFEIFTNLFLHSLLPAALLEMEQFASNIPLHATVPQTRPSGRGDGGLLSALSSYLLTPYNSSAEAIPEATDSEIENTLCTIDCLAACRLEELYAQIPALRSESLVWAVRALEALAHERTVARLKQEFDDTNAVSSPSPSRKNPPVQTLSYDPGSIFLLEMMISIITRTPQYIEETWPVAYEHLSALLSSASSYSILLIERAVAGLWRLLLVIADKPSLRDQLYLSLDLIGGLPASVATAVGEQIMAGVVELVKTRRDIIRSQTEWGLVLSLMRSSMRQPAASRKAFELLTTIVTDGPEQHVSPDNFAGLVSLFDEYASAAGSAVESAGQRDKRKDSESPLFEHVIQRGKQSVDTLFEMKKFIPRFRETERIPAEQLWKQCSLPLIFALARQSTSAAREIRHGALIHLQRILLGQQVLLPGVKGLSETVFDQVVLPLMDNLFQPQIMRRDPRGISETRLRASVLLCKVFIQLEVNDSAKEKDIRPLWMEILDLLDRLMNADKRDQLSEAIPESLKNVVLVMNAMDILVPPSAEDKRSERQKDLWKATHDRIDRFLPGFLDEVLPSPPPPAPAPPAAPTTEPIQSTPTPETSSPNAQQPAQ